MKSYAALKEWVKDVLKRKSSYSYQLNELLENRFSEEIEVKLIEEQNIIRKSDVDDFKYQKKIFERKTSTSGTTGKPLIFYQSLGALQKEQAFVDWLWQLVGYTPFDKVLVMRGGKGIDISSKFLNRLLLSSFEWDEISIIKKYEEFISFKPDFIDCYPSILERFIKGCIQLGMTEFPSVKGVLAGSEACLDHQESLFKKVLGAETLNWYGQSEQVAFGLKIDKDTFHFFPQYSDLKFLQKDGRYEIVGKSKLSKFFSRFYYATGDYCTSVTKGFNDKLNVPVYIVEGLTGRDPEVIKLKNLNEVPLNHIIFGLHSKLWSSIDRYCFVQIEPGIMCFYYSQFSNNILINDLIGILKERFPQGVILKVVEKPDLSLINASKWRYYFPNKTIFQQILSESYESN